MKCHPLMLLCVLSVTGFTNASTGNKEIDTSNVKLIESKKVVEIEYDSNSLYQFNAKEKTLIKAIITKAEIDVRTQLPTLATKIKVLVTSLDREINQVGGVTGRAEAAGEVLIQISTKYPGGVLAAIKQGLSASIYHEFHHLVRGWTMKGNHFDAGIPIAAVNEGLAVLFAEKYTGVIEEGNAYPKNISLWVKEILDLPKYANYGEWMMLHSDGREAIGYKSGKYIVEQAMKQSGMDVLEMSKIAPYEILKMSGVMSHHAASYFKLGESYENKQQPKKAIEAYQMGFELSQLDELDNGKNYLKRIELIKRPILFSKEDLAKLNGQFKYENYLFTMTNNSNILIANNKGWPQLELIAESKNKFYIRGNSITFEYFENNENQFNRLVFIRGTKTIELSRVK